MTRQWLIALGASIAMLLGIAGVAVAARSATIVGGVGASGIVRDTGHRIIIRDDWCMQSEDSCRINFRPNGAWVLVRRVP